MGLELTLPALLERAIHPDTWRLYTHIFGHLLRISYAERMIQSRWKKIANTCVFLPRADIDRLMLLRYRMHTFLKRYQSFLFLEVIDTHSRAFEKALGKLKFQAIRTSHLDMLARIAQRGLIVPRQDKAD